MKFAVAVFLLAAAVQVYALPDGAPIGACADIFPVGHSPAASASPVNQVANPTDITATPYQLSLQGFRYYIDMQTPGYRYYPGIQYYRKCYNLFSSAMGPQRFSICEYLLYNRFAFEPDLGRLFFCLVSNLVLHARWHPLSADSAVSHGQTSRVAEE